MRYIKAERTVSVVSVPSKTGLLFSQFALKLLASKSLTGRLVKPLPVAFLKPAS